MQCSYTSPKVFDKQRPISIFGDTLWGCSSVVEHLPFKQRAEGSIPSTLTKGGDRIVDIDLRMRH
jgi:hypothetical protein